MNNSTTHRITRSMMSFLTLTVLLLQPSFAQHIVINEFLASNVTDFPEMYDFVDFADWVELYNSEDSTISLNNYFLSDDITDPIKWKIPASASIDPSGYFMIWADGFDEGPGSNYTRATWPWADYITQHYHANFKLSKSGEDIVLSRADVATSETLISQGSIWKYLDDGSDQGNSWTSPSFDDASWEAGAAELGYGDGDEMTTLDFGPESDNKYITSYFRKTVNVPDATLYQHLRFALKRDDGAVVYLNGAELFRSNMPLGSISYETQASSAVSSGNEDAYFEYSMPTDELLNGENVLAVEIHQISGSSSDVSFDLSLTAVSFGNVEIVDNLSYGQQITDVSYGRVNATETWGYFGEPTFGAANITTAIIDPIASSPVTASLPAGFYPLGETVSLNSANPGAQIFYTLDGSRPTSDSQTYSGSIALDQTVVLKTRAIEAEKLPGPIFTGTYLINESAHLPTISLVAEPPTLWDADIGIYENEYKQREIPVNIEYFSMDLDLNFALGAGARLGGMNIWTKPQKPFTIYTRDRFGPDVIPYQLFPNKPISDFSRVVFRNGGDDWEETLLRDPMTGSLVSGMMDCGYMAYQPASLYLNGDYWGIYNIREKYNKQYFFENFGVDPDNVDHLEYASTDAGTRLMVIEGDLQAYNDLISFIQNNDLNSPAVYEELLQRMNVDGFIDHVSMTLYCANTSWGHNREWWRSREPGSKWQWLIVDVDRGFNLSNLNTNLLDNLMRDYLLFYLLMEGQHFQDRFLQRASAHFNNTFHSDRISDIVDSLSATTRPELPRHIERWGNAGGISSLSGWESELDAIKTFANSRSSILFNQFNTELGLDGTIQLTALTTPPGAGMIAINKVPVLNQSTTGTYFKNHPLQLKAIPAPGFEFIGWTSGADSAEIQYGSGSDTSFTAQFQATGDMILPAVISSDMTLDLNHHYAVSQNLTVPAGVTLTVEPGVEISMPRDGHFIVEGQLIINGSQANPVLLQANTSSESITWGGLSFDNSVDTSFISHLNISGATRGYDPLIFRGAISAHHSNLIIDHVNISNVRFPIYVEGGYSRMSNCSISCDYISDFINVKRGDVVIDSCTFYGNQAPDTDAIDLDGVTNGVISNNWIYNFSGNNSDGIDIGESSQGIRITSNLIYHASDKGVSVGQSSSVILERNLIVGCLLGVAIKDSASAIITNNTFANNEYAVACYEKNEGAGGGTAEISNSIMAGNLLSATSVDGFSELSVAYSLSDTEILTGISNFFADPGFIEPEIYNFQLNPNSLCIDAGNPGDPLDEYGSIVDMGAYYSYHLEDYPFDIPGQHLNQIRINEFLASNSGSNADDNDEFDDWLELFNPTEQRLDLSHLYLTDNRDNLTKWQFPDGSTTIEAGGFLLIWCDSDIDQGEFHTNFKLSASGEFLALVGSNGLTIIDSLSFGSQTTDISFGRQPDGSSSWGSMTPSPGASNNLLGLSIAPFIPEQLALEQNFPNPFNPVTTIRYGVPADQQVQLIIYDLRGRRIRTLVDQPISAGFYSVSWNALDDNGIPVSSGIYLYAIKTRDSQLARKVLLLR